MVNVPAAATADSTDSESGELPLEMTSVTTTDDPDSSDAPSVAVETVIIDPSVVLVVPPPAIAPSTLHLPIVQPQQPVPAAIAVVAPTARLISVAPAQPVAINNNNKSNINNGHSKQHTVVTAQPPPPTKAFVPLQQQQQQQQAQQQQQLQSQQQPPQPGGHTIMNHVVPPPSLQQHAQTTPIFLTARQFVGPPPFITNQHVHTIGQMPPGQWPIVDPVFHFGPGFEHQHYCPTHSQGPQPNEHVVFFHVNIGVSVTFLIGGNNEIIRGPVTVPMVSQGGSPPVPMPVQVPAGHLMQQIVDETGTLRHVILSTAQHPQTTVQGVPMQTPFPNNTGHYYQPIAGGPGSGPPHYHALPPGHPHQNQQMPGHHHSPTPPIVPYHKDERSQRQHTKMLRKLEKNREQPRTKADTNGGLRFHLNNNNNHHHTNNSNHLHHHPTQQIHIQPHIHHHQHSQPLTNHLLHAPLLSNGTSTTASGAASTASYEDGEDASSVATDDEDIAALLDQLSSVQPPQVSEITPRTALLNWSPPTAPSVSSSPTTESAPATPPPLNQRDLRYEVLLSDRGKENKYKIIFKGMSDKCRIRDLRPGQEYSVCLQVYLQDLHGSPSEANVFTTPGCEPDQPLPPKLIAKTKNSLQLRWNAPVDNGSHIQQYVLEYDEGKTVTDGEPNFVEVMKMKGKTYSVPKLQPSTWYLFRLAAVNEFGRSVYSETAAFSTAGNAPPQMPPPQLVDSETTANQLCLVWQRRHPEEDYMLQMNDQTSGHGFLTRYTGPDTQHVCDKLKRATDYQFRLRAENESGFSQWSETVTYTTNPERPGRPSRPQIKGKTHSTSFKAKWEAPLDRGGAEITSYSLQIGAEAHNNAMETIFTGPETETICDRLSPGTTYHIRVNCEGPGGISAFSDPTSVTTEAVVPVAPAAPICGQTPGPFAASLRWREPDYNGGAAIAEFEVKLITPVEDVIAYKGKDLHFIAKDLIPGTKYSVQVRAINRIGGGPWSEEFHFTAGAAAPFAPEQPEVSVQSSGCVIVTWREPMANGSAITEYQLCSATWLEPLDDHSESQPPKDDSFSICYQGIECRAEVKHLLPHTRYAFRVSAKNAAGTSLFSTPASIRTPAAAPSAPVIDWHTSTADDVTIRWRPSESNGSPIIYYNVDCHDKSVTQTEDSDPEWTISDLLPETTYKIRVQAVNEIGAGPFSHSIRVTTRALPPRPPKLECTAAGHNFLRLRWADGKNLDFTRFYLEMYNGRAKEFQPVYDGKLMTFKVNKLQELQTYVFRIGAESDTAGAGDFSEDYEFQTTATLPSSIRAPRCVDVEAQALHLEWQHSRNGFADPVEYVLQMHASKETEFKQVYRGRDTHFKVTDLETSHEYTFRVCPVRISDSGIDYYGTYSTTLRQRTAVPSSLSSGTNDTHHGANGTDHVDAADIVSCPSGSLSNSLDLVPRSLVQRVSGKWTLLLYNRKKMSDQDRAVVYSISFLVGSILLAWIIRIIMQQALG